MRITSLTTFEMVPGLVRTMERKTNISIILSQFVDI